ncbi:deoxyribonuclease IV [Fusibacter ferrireducens]|uniref:Probable endonuclease 4 n=1 Tax=Fusibacter ferrireducens TaxID=2785058 RepID=A0ABS0A0L0_9FIRM|nr:deoxyribonuclease IV [Fusibacter ferrireducens]MBF4695685.1 deoxyribonuclease IV [Fusibacter ferrireducens]
MLRLGPHISIAKGFYQAAKDASQIHANTFQFFTRNPRGGSAKEIDPKDIESLKELMNQQDIAHLLAHAPYTMNPAAQKDDVYAFAKSTFSDDLKRLEKVPCCLYNFHPGSHTGKGVEYGIQRITTLLNDVLTGDEKLHVLLEGMSGKGTEIGSTFEELRAIIDQVTQNHILGVCLDTCHLYSAGYDIVNQLDDVIEQFDQIVGLDRLKAMHLNDSKVPFGSHKDRHEIIGQGTIGIEALSRIINHPKLRHLPFFLETPNELEGHGKEVATLRALYKSEA